MGTCPELLNLQKTKNKSMCSIVKNTHVASLIKTFTMADEVVRKVITPHFKSIECQSEQVECLAFANMGAWRYFNFI